MYRDNERIVFFDNHAFARRMVSAMDRANPKITLNRISEETFVPYQTVQRMRESCNVYNIEAIFSVGKYLGIDPVEFIR